MERYPEYPHAATNDVPSGNLNEVAPVQQPQVYEPVPGQAPIQDNSQPGMPNQQVEPQAPQVDYAARLRETEQRLERERNQNQQYNQVFQQIKQHTEQERAAKEQQERVQAIVAHAEALEPGQQSTYIRDQMLNMQRQEQTRAQQMVQQERQRAEQAIKMAAMPQYADHIIESLKLPPEAKQELLSLGDPELMFRQSQQIKVRYDQMEQLRQQIQQSTQQGARSNEVNAMRQNGLTNIGGQAASGFNPQDLPSDPNDRAMAIYEQLQARKQGVY